MKNFILYNPLAGSTKESGYLDLLKKRLGAEAIVTDITTVKSFEDYFSQITEEDSITLCGGDGTLNKFINRIDTDSIKNRIFYYAAGSGNDFLHDVREGSDDRLIEINDYIRNLPTVTANGESYKFINGVGYGLDGYCCEVGDRLRSQSGKAINYTLIAIKALLFEYKPTDATVIVDGKEYHYSKVWVAPTMNGRCYGGGMKPTPCQDRLNPDHSLSVMVFHDTGKLKTLKILSTVFSGDHVKFTDAITIHEGKEVTVRFNRPAPLQIDGETISGVSEYTVRSGALVKI